MALALRQSYKSVSTKIQSSVAVTAGDLIIVGLYQDGALVETSAADNAAGGSNTYAQIGTGIYVGGGSGCGIYVHYAIAKATETISITGTFAGTGYNLIFVHVVSGAGQTLGTVLNTSNTKADATGATSHTSAAVTTTKADTYLFCFWGEAGGAYTISENGAGFTERQEDHGTATYDRIVAEVGTYSGAVTSTGSVRHASILAAFSAYEAPSPGGKKHTFPVWAFGIGMQG